MFICQFSGEQVGEGIKPVKIVVQRRARTYENTDKKRTIVSQGWEIQKELLVSPNQVENCKKHYNLTEESVQHA